MLISNANCQPVSDTKNMFSKHALKRVRQRGLSALVVRLVTAFGKKEFDGQGGIRYCMTPTAINELRRAVGSTQQVDALSGVYAVVSATDNTVITVGHLY